MSTLSTQSTRFHNGFRRLGGVLALAAAFGVFAAPAMADPDHRWREREWREHHRHDPLGYYAPPPRVYYAPPPVVYAPPPRVYYAPPPVVYQPAPSLNFVFR